MCLQLTNEEWRALNTERWKLIEAQRDMIHQLMDKNQKLFDQLASVLAAQACYMGLEKK